MAKKIKYLDKTVVLVFVKERLEKILDNDELSGDTREDINDLLGLINSTLNHN